MNNKNEKGAFEQSFEYLFSIAVHNIGVEMIGEGKKIELPKNRIKYYVYEVISPIDYVYNAQDIHNGTHLKYDIGQEIESREDAENVYSILWHVKDKLKFKEIKTVMK